MPDSRRMLSFIGSGEFESNLSRRDGLCEDMGGAKVPTWDGDGNQQGPSRVGCHVCVLSGNQFICSSWTGTTTMSFQGLISGTECGTAANPLSQVLKHTEGDRSLQQVSI